TIYAVNGTYDDCSRLSVELSFERDWAFVNVGLRSYYAEGSKTLAFEIAEQLGWSLPDAVVAPIASGAMFLKVHQGFGELRAVGVVEGPPPRLRRDTFPRSLAIGNPADGDLAVATAKASGGAIHAVAEDEVGENMALLAERPGVFGEPPAGAP